MAKLLAIFSYVYFHIYHSVFADMATETRSQNILWYILWPSFSLYLGHEIFCGLFLALDMKAFSFTKNCVIFESCWEFHNFPPKIVGKSQNI